jgi:hypothetical protein
LRKIFGLAVATVAMAASTASAEAAPKGVDVHRAVKAADASLAGTAQWVHDGDYGAAAVQIARTRTLEARAVRLAHRVADRSDAAGAAKQLHRAAGAVDRGFNAYAALLPVAPPELQGALVDALTEFDGMRSALAGQLTSLVNVLPPEVREQVTAAIEAFQKSGDLKALIAAVGDPEIAAAIRAHLGELVDQVVAMLQAKLDSPEAADLPPEVVEQIQDIIALIQANREEIIQVMDQIITSGGQVPDLSPEMCGQLKLVFAQLGVPLPAGVCEGT